MSSSWIDHASAADMAWRRYRSNWAPRGTPKARREGSARFPTSALSTSIGTNSAVPSKTTKGGTPGVHPSMRELLYARPPVVCRRTHRDPPVHGQRPSHFGGAGNERPAALPFVGAQDPHPADFPRRARPALISADQNEASHDLSVAPTEKPSPRPLLCPT